nr:mucin-16-like [Oryctolagus cuniculus]
METSSTGTTISTAGKTAGHSDVPTGAFTEITRTEAISSGGNPTSGLAQSTESPDTHSGKMTRFPISPVVTEQAQLTTTTQITHLGTAAPSTLAAGKQTPAWLVGTQSGLEVTDLLSMGPENVLRATTASVDEATSAFTMQSLPAMASPPVPSTLPEGSPSSPLIASSQLTSTLRKTTEVLKTSQSPESSPSLNLSSAAVSALAFSEVTPESENVPPSSEAAASTVEPTSPTQGPLSSAPADPESSTATSPQVASTLGDTSISLSTHAFLNTTRMHRGPTSSLPTERRATSTPEGTSSTAETSTGLYGWSTSRAWHGANTEDPQWGHINHSHSHVGGDSESSSLGGDCS